MKRSGKLGFSVKKGGVYQGFGKTWKQGLEPAERQKAIELKIEIVGLRFIEIPRQGKSKQ